MRSATLLPAMMALAGVVTVSASRALPAQQASAASAARRDLSLAEALRIAEKQSEAVRIAQAGVQRARGQQMQARSQYLPQVNGTASYTRTLASQFEALAEPGPTPPPGTPPVPPADTTTFFQPCNRYLAPAGAPDAERVRGLDAFARCSSVSGIDFSKVGFGSKNQYSVGLAGSLNLFTGGRVTAQNQAASAGRRSADIELVAQRAQLTLDVTQAYYDAALADRLAAIAESSLVWTESALRQTRLARQVGNQSEFELLRAQVTRDNQVPPLLQQRTNRDLAYLRLKQLLNLPYDDSLRLTDGIGDTTFTPSPVRAAALTRPTSVQVAREDTSASERATVRQLAEAVRVSEAQRRAVLAERIPSLQLSTSYGRLAFPQSGAPSWGNFLTNWTVTVGASMPLFTGGRLRGDQLVAQANLAESRARLDQTRELAALDGQLTVAQLAQAEASVAASAGTAEQASRAYQIAEVRYREGISTQLELSESRLLFQQALANRALAWRDLQVAKVRIALLKDLPLGSAGALGGAGSPAGAGAAPPGGALPRTGAPQQQQQSQPRAQSASANITGQ